MLSGSDDRFFVDRVQQLFAGRGVKGGAVRLTLDPRRRRRRTTGSRAAPAPWSRSTRAPARSSRWPPRRRSTPTAQQPRPRGDPQGLRRLQRRPREAAAQPAAGAWRCRPGSTFKLVTAAAALESGQYTPTPSCPARPRSSCPLTDKELRNWSRHGVRPRRQDHAGRTRCAISCNTAFASIGMDLGDDALREQAEKFGFGTSFEVPLRAATSHFPEDPDEPQTAMSAIGQFDVTRHRAADGDGRRRHRQQRPGDEPLPRLAGALRPSSRCSRPPSPWSSRQAMSPANAAELLAMMVTVVDQGTGSNARDPRRAWWAARPARRRPAPGQPPHAWFVGVAPASTPGAARGGGRRGAAERRRRGGDQRQPAGGSDRQVRDGSDRGAMMSPGAAPGQDPAAEEER